MIYAILRINQCPKSGGKMVNIKNYEASPLIVSDKQALEAVRKEYQGMYPDADIFMRYEEFNPTKQDK